MYRGDRGGQQPAAASGSSTSSAARVAKVVLVGDGNAGKTSLRSRLLFRKFQPSYRATIGADFVTKTFSVPRSVVFGEEANGGASRRRRRERERRQKAEREGEANEEVDEEEAVKVQLSIWDTAGQERFRSLGAAFYRGADAVVLAFDASDRASLERTLTWYDEFRRLGAIGWDEEGEHGNDDDGSAISKRAREQKRRFCWVAVGCKADALSESLSEQQEHESSGEQNAVTGIVWDEARQWFDGLLAREVPEQDVNEALSSDPERAPEWLSRYTNSSDADTGAQEADSRRSPRKTSSLDIPAKPEDVLSRPHQRNVSCSSTNSSNAAHSPSGTERESAPTTSARPPGAGTPPGQQASARLLKISDASRSSPSTSPRKNAGLAVQQSNNGADSSSRNRYDSTATNNSFRTGAGGSIYYSVRGSTFFSGSPGTQSSNATAGPSKSGKKAPKEVESAESVDESDTVGQKGKVEDDEKGSGDAGSSTATTKGPGSPAQPHDALEEAEIKEEESPPSPAVIPTIPSGDPIPFPVSQDSDEEKEDSEEVVEVPRRRGGGGAGGGAGKRRSVATARQDRNSILANGSHENDEAQDDGQRDEADPRRFTLYSARPSSIASTVKAHQAEDSHEAGEERLEGANDDLEESSESGIYDDDDDEEGNRASPAPTSLEEGFRLFYTSSKDGLGVDEVFQHVATRCARRWAYEDAEEERRRRKISAAGHGAEGGRKKRMSFFGTWRRGAQLPETDEERDQERIRRAIRVSSGKESSNCCF